MWKYVKKYLPFAIIAAVFLVGDILMDLIQPEIMSRIVDDGVLGLNNGGTGSLQLIWEQGLIMIGLVLAGALFGSLNTMFAQMTGQNVGNDIRKDCFRSIMTFSFPQADRFGTASLVTRVTNDITQIQHFAAHFVQGLLRTVLLMFGSIFFLFRVNRDFGLVVLCVFPLMLACIIICLYKANPLFGKLQAQLDKINSILQEDVSGIRIIKACVREIYEKVRFGKANGELIKTQLQVLIIFSFMNPIVNALMYIVVALILLLGSFEVTAGQTSPGDIMAAITYTTQLLNAILRVVMLFQSISRGVASWGRVKEVLSSRPDLEDGSFDGTTDLRGQIEFKDVSFSYPGSSQVILKHIDLTIRPGETVAVMGATGCGKSTLVHLIPRFYDATEGSVLVDGVDVREYDQQALREKVAIAPQKSELFSMPIRENIAWGRPGAPDEAIVQAARIAQADDFIRSTPDGYNTMVAERGMSLSGGQKQRISIARAVLKGSEILIFDDSTSALDLKTEADLYAALEQAHPDSTKIIIAQRVASVRRADRIVVLEQGGIAACGTHEELLRHSKTYRDIYDSQMGEEGEIDG